jgi:cell division protein FtsA
MSSRLVAGLDIGSTKIAAVIAELADVPGKPPDVRVLGVGRSRSTGMRREVVTDLEATTASIRRAVQEAELMAGVSVEGLYTGLAGEHVHGRASTGVVAVSGGEIFAADIDRVHEVAQAIAVPADREVLHAIPQEYLVDAQGGIRYPAGMAGTRLEAEVFLITGSGTAAQNIRRAVYRAGYRVEELVFEPLAASLATLTDDDKDAGVALVDLGAGTTDIIIFHERKIVGIATLPWGGSTVSSDIAKGLSIPYAEAVQTKERWGAASAAGIDPNDSFEISHAATGEPRHVARELLAHIIEQRVDEILGLVADQIEASGSSDRLGAGVVLTGGGAALPGLVGLAEHTFAAPVRVGFPGRGLGGLADSVRSPKFSGAAGLVLYGARRTLSDSTTGSAFGNGSSVNGVIKWMRDWLTDFF